MNIYLYRIFVSETLFQLTDTAVNSSTRVSNKLQQDIVWKHVTMEYVATNILPEEMLHSNTYLTALKLSLSVRMYNIPMYLFCEFRNYAFIHSTIPSYIHGRRTHEAQRIVCLFLYIKDYTFGCVSASVSLGELYIRLKVRSILGET